MITEWWQWIFVIAGGLLLAGISYILFSIIIGLIAMWSGKIYWHTYAWAHNRKARKLNEKARLERLKRTDWEGIRLPMGKSGELTYSVEEQMSWVSVDSHRLEKVLKDRADDLGVEFQFATNNATREISVRWAPRLRVDK